MYIDGDGAYICTQARPISMVASEPAVVYGGACVGLRAGLGPSVGRSKSNTTVLDQVVGVEVS